MICTDIVESPEMSDGLFHSRITLHEPYQSTIESQERPRSISRILRILDGQRRLRLHIQRSSKSFVDTYKMWYVYQNFVMHRENSVDAPYRTVCMLSHSHSAESKGESTIRLWTELRSQQKDLGAGLPRLTYYVRKYLTSSVPRYTWLTSFCFLRSPFLELLAIDLLPQAKGDIYYYNLGYNTSRPSSFTLCIIIFFLRANWVCDHHFTTMSTIELVINPRGMPSPISLFR